jgi:hypothetical protein
MAKRDYYDVLNLVYLLAELKKYKVVKTTL